MSVKDNPRVEGGRLRERRRAAGISQQELASRAGCSVSIVQLLEGGYQPRRSDVLPRLVAALDLEAAEEVKN